VSVLNLTVAIPVIDFTQVVVVISIICYRLVGRRPSRPYLSVAVDNVGGNCCTIYWVERDVVFGQVLHKVASWAVNSRCGGAEIVGLWNRIFSMCHSYVASHSILSLVPSCPSLVSGFLAGNHVNYTYPIDGCPKLIIVVTIPAFLKNSAANAALAAPSLCPTTYTS
jgi:hypothetical protein